MEIERDTPAFGPCQQF